MRRLFPALSLLTLLVFFFLPTAAQAQFSFTSTGLSGASVDNPTSLQFGPDGRLYVSQQNGLIKAFTVARTGTGQYTVTATEVIDLVQKIQNHNDDGSLHSTQKRQVTGLVVTGTAAVPVLYVSSSDYRIGAGGSGEDKNLDTNSGIITRLIKTNSGWAKLDLVRGLPRSEENHATNGLQYDAANNRLFVMQGGHTNMGGTSNNFAYLPEFALSAALLTVDLNAISTTYDLPTLDDPSRPNTSSGDDVGDPFGGNDGANQAILDPTGPVQVYSPGWRNAYDVVLTSAGRLYTVDNGPNSGWGGIQVGCTQAEQNTGTTYNDNLHFISGPGYYGGHPNPTRGSLSNTFNGVSPVAAVGANPIECTYKQPGNGDGALTTFGASTNGITEYTASNFSGAMQGSLLTASFDGTIYLITLNSSGTQMLTKSSLLTGFGAAPLDVTSQGDTDLFPGTVWAATYGADAITVFEPQDFGTTCTAADDAGLDEDNDNFNNADEIANGTNPCSAGSTPPDADGDFVSDLNDADDDNDGISDLTDLFQRDADNGTTTFLPRQLDFIQASFPTSMRGLGFTGLMSNGTDYLGLYDEANLTTGGAASKFTIDAVPAGDAHAGTNTQAYGFQFGLNVASETMPFTVHSRIATPFADVATGNWQSIGFFVGTGDQDNYLKVVATGAGAGGIEVLKEVNGGASGQNYAAYNPIGTQFVDLFLTIDPVAGTAQPAVSIEGGAVAPLGAPIAVPAAWLDVLAVGLISTSNGPAPEFIGTWDFLHVTSDGSTGGNTAPELAPIAYQQVEAGQTLNIAVSATDADAGDSITLTTSSLPGFAAFNASGAAGTLTLAPTAADAGTFPITITATDLGGNTDTETLLVTVVPDAAGVVAVHRINAGGPAYTDTNGHAWSADAFFSTGTSTYTNVTPIANTTDDALYQTERYGDPMSYALPVPAAGDYTVVLHFAEIFQGVKNSAGAGARVFGVDLEGGTETVTGLDLLANTAPASAMRYVFSGVTVNDGLLNLLLDATTDKAKLSAIEVLAPLTNTPSGVLAASPTNLPFFSQTVGTASAAHLVTVENTGTGPLSVTSATLTGAHAGDFSVTFAGPLTLAAGATADVPLTFTPSATGLRAATLTFGHDGTNGAVAVNLNGEGVDLPTGNPGDVLYRVNAGAATLTAADNSTPDWSGDFTTTPSAFTNAVAADSKTYSTSTTVTPDASVGAAVPAALFQSERYDPVAGVDMAWSFPVQSGTAYTVRLYFAEVYFANAGQRVFDVLIEDVLAFDDVDQVAVAGKNVGFALDYTVTPTDNSLDIVFGRQTENPAVKGIEIAVAESGPTNAAPVLTVGNVPAVEEGSPLNVALTATDEDGDALTLGTTNLPVFGSLTDNGDGTGTLAFAPQPGDAGSYTFSVTATDGTATAQQTATLEVTALAGTPSALIEVNAGGGLFASTYTNDAFKITNTGTVAITQVVFDLSTSLLPDVVFDPNGTAGDSGAKCFTPNTGAGTTGLVTPADACTTPFSQPHNGTNGEDGFDTLTMAFTDFGASEVFTFSTDIDPTSIKNDPNTGDAGSVSGLEMAGASVTLTFADGTVVTSSLFEDGSLGGAAAVVAPDAPVAPAISVGTITGNGSVSQAAQTVTVTGPANTTVTLLHADARLYLDASVGYDLDAFEANEVVAVQTTTVTLDGSGQANVPITLLETASPNAGPNGGLNHFLAVVEGPAGQRSRTSNRLVLNVVPETVAGSLSAPGSVDFAIVNTGVSVAQDVQIMHAGDATTAPVTISALTIVNDVDGAFSVGTLSAPVTLQPGETVAVLVTFAPTTAGAKTAQLKTEHDGTNNPLIVQLTGTGVTPTNAAPTLAHPGAQLNMRGDDVTLQLAATDDDGDAITYGATGLPAGLTVNADGLIAGTLTATAGTYVVTVSASDGEATAYQAFDWTVTEVTSEAPVRPIFECVVRHGPSDYTARFGYLNENAYAVDFAVGSDNGFAPAPADRGQPTTFQPGRQHNVFTVDFNGSNIVWTLDGRTASASRHQEKCADQTVAVDLEVTNEVNDPTPKQWEVVTFTVQVENKGTSEAQGIVVRALLPTSLSYLSDGSFVDAGHYDPLTGLWTLDRIGAGATVTLVVNALVETEAAATFVAEVMAAATPDADAVAGNGDPTEDDYAEATVSPDGVSGGNDAGVESNGNAATLMANRRFRRHRQAQLNEGLRVQNALVPFTGLDTPAAPVTAPYGVAPMAYAPAMETAAASRTNVLRLIPTEGPMQASAFVTSPEDLVGVTNALSVFAVDYVRADNRRIGAVFTALTQSELYDHTKIICDRLGGGTLEHVQLTDVDGHPFVLVKMHQPSGQVDYAITLVAFRTAEGYVVDSRFSRDDYVLPEGVEEVLNVQVWSAAPRFTAALVGDILTELEASSPVTYLNTQSTAPLVPQVYVHSGAYANGTLSLNVVNHGAAGSITIEGTAAATESDADTGRRSAFGVTVPLPAAMDGTGRVTVDVPVGHVFDATFSVTTDGQAGHDQLYYADGPWSYMTDVANQGSTATAFHTLAEQRHDDGGTSRRLTRSAHLEGDVTTWASLFRFFNVSHKPEDFSAFDAIEFTASGQGEVQMVLEKAGIEGWDHFATTFQLTDTPQRLKIPFGTLRRANGVGGFTAEDVHLLAFYLNGDGQTARPFRIAIEDVRFVRGTASTPNEGDTALPTEVALEKNFPNPFAQQTTIRYALPEASAVTLTVYDVMGRAVRTLVDGPVAAGAHDVRFDATDLPAGTYLYRLVTPTGVKSGKMLVVN